MTIRLLALLAAISLATIVSNGAPPDPGVVRKMWTPFTKPIPKGQGEGQADKALIDLGRQLFFERALSPDGTRSCNDCHDLAKYGTNGAAALEAREAGKLRRDVPSVFNLAELKLLRWDGSETDLRSQTAAALTSKLESALPDADALVARLAPLPPYRELTFDRVVDALTAFQEGLVTRAPFDDFLLGDDEALTPEQLEGAVLFESKNCSACHTGSTIGGQMLQRAGIVKAWPNQEDQGLFEVSGKEIHKMGFRVPPLRNVAETAPYFHDHSARSLRRAIRDIALREQGMFLQLDEISSIEAFLKSFTGELPADYIRPPARVESEQ